MSSWASISYGQLDLDELEHQLDDDTALVTIMYANNETGVIFPVEQIAEMVTGRGIVFHTDAVQVVGKIPLNLSKSPINLLSLSGHKLHAPKGVGVLYVKKGTRVAPFLLGGHQEGGRRAGTENVPGIIGLGKACELAAQNLADENTRVKRLRDKLEKALLKTCPDSRVNGDSDHRLPNTANISFEFVEGEAILLLLDRSASAPPAAPPAPPARWSRRTSCGRWACPSPPPTARSASASAATTRRKKWTSPSRKCPRSSSVSANSRRSCKRPPVELTAARSLRGPPAPGGGRDREQSPIEGAPLGSLRLNGLTPSWLFASISLPLHAPVVDGQASGWYHFGTDERIKGGLMRLEEKTALDELKRVLQERCGATSVV